MTEPLCTNCGYPRREHSHEGACYGLCGEFQAGDLVRELVAALKQLVTDYEDVPNPTDADGQAVFEAARIAITKAERSRACNSTRAEPFPALRPGSRFRDVTSNVAGTKFTIIGSPVPKPENLLSQYPAHSRRLIKAVMAQHPLLTIEEAIEALKSGGGL
jgi:hypothetical protein